MDWRQTTQLDTGISVVCVVHAGQSLLLGLLLGWLLAETESETATGNLVLIGKFYQNNVTLTPGNSELITYNLPSATAKTQSRTSQLHGGRVAGARSEQSRFLRGGMPSRVND